MQDFACISEEHQQCEEHLVKMESRLQEVLHKFELEARHQHGDFVQQYSELTPDTGPEVTSCQNLMHPMLGFKIMSFNSYYNQNTVHLQLPYGCCYICYRNFCSETSRVQLEQS